VARRIIETLGRRVRYLGEQVESLMVSDVPSRLLKLLACRCCQNLSDFRLITSPMAFLQKLSKNLPTLNF